MHTQLQKRVYSCCIVNVKVRLPLTKFKSHLALNLLRRFNIPPSDPSCVLYIRSLSAQLALISNRKVQSLSINGKQRTHNALLCNWFPLETYLHLTMNHFLHDSNHCWDIDEKMAPIYVKRYHTMHGSSLSVLNESPSSKLLLHFTFPVWTLSRETTDFPDIFLDLLFSG